MCKSSLSGADSTTPTYFCSEPSRGSKLRTYYIGSTLTGECTNPSCRLVGVTLSIQKLLNLTEDERQAWQRTNDHIRAIDAVRRQEAAEFNSRLPPHLRKSLG